MKQFNLTRFSNDCAHVVAMAVTSLWSKKMRAGITLLFLLVCNIAHGQLMSLNWVKGIGGTNGDMAYAVVADAAGCTYVGGVFTGTADFDPGPNTVNFVSNGSNDIFIAKYDANGNYVWAFRIGGTGSDELTGTTGLAIDDNGYIYVTGLFRNTVDFDPGTAVANLVSNGGSDMFVAKYDTAGNYVWAKKAGSTGSSGHDAGIGITTDNSGNVYVTGYFVTTMYFDTIGSPNIVSANANDCFFVKYDANGVYQWSKRIGGTGTDQGKNIAVDAIGNIYVSGVYESSTNLNPAGTANFTSNGGTECFVAKYTPAGNYIWGFSVGGAGWDEPMDMALDEATASIWLVGAFANTVNFAPRATTAANLIATSSGGTNGFIAKYDTSGHYITAKSIEGGDNSFVNAVIVSAFGDVYICGNFKGTPDFDPGSSVANHTSAGTLTDAFMAKYDASINYLWSGAMGGPGSFWTRGLSLASSENNIYMSGWFYDLADFDPGPGTVELPTYSSNIDGFVLKMSDGCPSLSSFSETACDSFIFNGTTYTATGIYKDTFTSILYGCDSIVTIDLTVNHSAVNPVVTGTYCDSVTFNGVTYDTTGVYTQEYFSFNGCDSIVTLDLTIISPTATVIKSGSVLMANSADSYQWINCADNSTIPGATDQSYTATVDGSYAVIITEDGCNAMSVCVTAEGEDVGINNPGAGNTARLYPNPADGRVNIQTGAPLTNATIRLVSITGQVLQQHTNQQGSLFLINMEAYAGGIYFIEITEAGSTARMRVVKE